jgi:hypothetical protein
MVSPLILLLAWFSFQVPFQGESFAKHGDAAAIVNNAAHAQHNSFFMMCLAFIFILIRGPELRFNRRRWTAAAKSIV